MPHTHKKTNKDRFKVILQFLKKVFTWAKDNLSKKGVQIGIAVIMAVMLMLGLSINWQCGSQGWECDGGYTPPNPDDVNKIIKPNSKPK